MAGIAHNTMRLLLFSFVRAGVRGEDGLIVPERSYDITFPCEEDSVCFHIWHFSATSDYIAIVTNGEIQTAKLEDEDAKCTLQIKGLTDKDVGRHHCQKGPDFFSLQSTSPNLNLMPGKTVSLQCILLTYVEQGYCDTQQQQISLTWVDETGAEIQGDSHHQIKRETSCDITLTVTFQSPRKKIRCQASVDEQVQTSVELRIRGPGRGRGLIIELEPQNEGGKQEVIGTAVGVVGCVVLTAVIAALVVNKRRTSSRLPESNTTSTNNDTNADDVIYADVILPAGSGRQVWIHECESTEYACVRNK